MGDLFHALGNPARRALVDELRHGAGRAGDVGRGLGISREAIGKHLRVLASAGLVQVEARGRERWYALRPEPLEQVDDWLEPYRAFWAQRLDSLATEIIRGRREAACAEPDPRSPVTNEPVTDHQQRGA